jgi:thiazole synthase ThiGH ThiG subunit
MPHSWADDTVLERERDRERERCALIADAFGDAAAASAAAAAVQFGTDEMLWRCDLASAGMARAIAERIRAGRAPCGRHPASPVRNLSKR